MAEDLSGIDFSDVTLESVENDTLEDTPPPTRTRKERADKGVKRGPRADGSPTSTPRRSSHAKLINELTQPIAQVAMGLAFTSPTAAKVLIERGESTAKSLVAIAEKHPRMLAALQRVSQIGPATDLAQTFLMLIIALQMDLGRIPVEHPLANATGVAHLYMQTHIVEENADGSVSFPVFSPPPGFGTPSVTDPSHPRYSFTAKQGAGTI